MFQHLIVPIDGSSAAFDSVRVAARMAAAVDGTLEVVTVVDRLADVASARLTLERGLERLLRAGPLPVGPRSDVLACDSVAAAVARRVESTPGAGVVMSSHGHGRSAAVLGSTTDELLREMFGPVIVIGPHCDVATAGRLDGTYVVPLDGSARADGVLAIVAAWTIEFGGTPWLVEVLGDWYPTTSDIVESAYVSHRAGELRERIGRAVEYEALHGEHPARSIVDYATNQRAQLIFLSTHGRTGLDRLRSGSVTAEVVRRARCPVVLFRPPELLARIVPSISSTVVPAAAPPVWSKEWCEQRAPLAAT